MWNAPSRRLARPWLLALRLLMLLLSPGAGADWKLEYSAPTPLFLDRSYLFVSPNRIHRVGDPESPERLLFEGQIAPNLFFPQLHTGGLKAPHGEWFLSAVFTPYIRLRLLDLESRPVIPPSYIPKLTFQVAHLRRLKEAEGRAHNGRGLVLAANFILGHHSNGQNGCFFANQTGVDPHCEPKEGEPPLNEVTGSFSTNFLRGELHGQYAFSVDPRLDNAWLVGGGSFLEFNVSLGPGGITDEQRRVYGDGNAGFNARVERIWKQHRFRGEVALSMPFGEMPGQRATVSAEVAAHPYWGAGFGVFARYLHGQDYYNILFLEKVSLWHFGLVFEVSPAARLRLEGVEEDCDQAEPR
ncbi:hypothetical protein [Myxococcus landrumensis]|uniref:Uncharacterized protein n=1 Tax=Myxococcus landrumensis TaxID=2813577 RepID=A0ABX7NHS8_9BACT|nr:hypothetical protein [Myxococcus landrumus]QSQ16936.1 hypothetical protein JY572_13165 [Myxococcus landrumus]